MVEDLTKEKLDLMGVKYQSAEQTRRLVKIYKTDPIVFADSKEIYLLDYTFDAIKVAASKGQNEVVVNYEDKYGRNRGYEFDTLRQILSIKGYKSKFHLLGSKVTITWGITDE